MYPDLLVFADYLEDNLQVSPHNISRLQELIFQIRLIARSRLLHRTKQKSIYLLYQDTDSLILRVSPEALMPRYRRVLWDKHCTSCCFNESGRGFIVGTNEGETILYRIDGNHNAVKQWKNQTPKHCSIFARFIRVDGKEYDLSVTSDGWFFSRDKPILIDFGEPLLDGDLIETEEDLWAIALGKREVLFRRYPYSTDDKLTPLPTEWFYPLLNETEPWEFVLNLIQKHFDWLVKSREYLSVI